jgi:serine O-acetyltransferase
LSADALANSRIKNITFSKKISELLFPDIIWKFIKLLRKTEYHKNSLGVFHKLFYVYNFYKFRKISVRLGFSIPLNVFGPGISIPHYGTIVVNGNSRIGKNCRIHACVNIGASGGSDVSPIIGDNVYIGPGAILFGEIYIANNITIAANATVYKSFEIKNTTIGGTPAVVLKEQTNTWWEKNRLSL